MKKTGKISKRDRELIFMEGRRMVRNATRQIHNNPANIVDSIGNNECDLFHPSKERNGICRQGVTFESQLVMKRANELRGNVLLKITEVKPDKEFLIDPNEIKDLSKKLQLAERQAIKEFADKGLTITDYPDGTLRKKIEI